MQSRYAYSSFMCKAATLNSLLVINRTLEPLDRSRCNILFGKTGFCFVKIVTLKIWLTEFWFFGCQSIKMSFYALLSLSYLPWITSLSWIIMTLKNIYLVSISFQLIDFCFTQMYNWQEVFKSKTWLPPLKYLTLSVLFFMRWP